jgi:protein-tyrosine phosphatase
LFPSVVIPGFLYLGSQCARSLVHQLGITHVLCIGEDACVPPLPAGCGCSELVLDVVDTAGFDIRPAFSRAIAFIDSAKTAPGNGSVLVHCAMGVSRSPAVVAAYLMVSRRLQSSEALAIVCRCRPIASPNKGFLAALLDFEKTIS